jgi:hypothetical protein
MHAYLYLSVHELLFHRVAERLVDYGVDRFSGFAWSPVQEETIRDRGVPYQSLLVFSRDLLPLCNDGREPDLGWLQRRERELGVSIERMIAAERHLCAGRTYSQIMRVAEVGLREIAAFLDRARPDFIVADDVACFHSYAHYVLARERGIPDWRIGSGRLSYRISVYSQGFQRDERVEAIHHDIRDRGLTLDERKEAEEYVTKFREKPVRPTGMDTRAKKVSVELADLRRLTTAVKFFVADRGNPTAIPPHRVLTGRLQRMARIRLAGVRGVFEKPVSGEQYVLYPLHFQPEASTLVQAPMYLDQLALVQDIARSLPAGHRLYVKEHLSSRGRRPLAYYEQLRSIPSVRLLGPDENTWDLIHNASAVAVITGTMGWEAMSFTTSFRTSIAPT